MLAARMIIGTILLFPLHVFGSYNSTHIKDSVKANHAIFQVDGWVETNDNGWEAKTIPRLLSIAISNKISTIRSPYISPKQKTIAKKRCEEFGLIGISPQSIEERKKIRYLIKKATRKHIPQFTDINNVRFEILPEMKGTFVSLVCKLKPSSLSKSN